MENSSDKFLKNKLSNQEFPFDPQAWEQMEALLDKKKKRRVFFWWWTGGAAALLLLLTAIAGLEINRSQKQNDPTGYSVNYQQAENNEVSQSKQKTASNTENKEQRAGNQHVATNKKPSPENKEGNRHSHQAATTVRGQDRFLHQQTKASKTKGHLTRIEKGKQAHRPIQPPTASRNLTAYQTELDGLNGISAKQNYTTANFTLPRNEMKELNRISENAVIGFEKQEEQTLPKNKKKVFNYSLGVLANVSGSTLGNQPVNQPQRPALFYKTPSYMLGLTHDFLFVNRVALSNSILFSQTSFKVYQPKSESFANPPITYTSHITEMAISVGLKVYPVLANKFRFYISTGIINHIKLKETFEYTALTDSNANLSSTLNLSADGFFPTQTNFGSKENAYDALNTGGLSNTISHSTRDFSINKAQRYYTSFYAGAGFEYVTRKRFVVFGEPSFYMSLQKIGIQEKRKYNLGLNAGFRYRF